MASMAWRRCVSCVTLGVVLTTPALAVGPPPVGPAQLTPQQQARLARWGRAASAAGRAGDAGRALRLAQEVESLRRQWQGPRHWQAIDERYYVDDWARLASLSPAAQREAARADAHNATGQRLLAQGKFAAAEKAHREALAIRQKALGEDHPETATSYNNLGYCLAEQGQMAKAQSLYEKVLAIRRKALGEEHPYTAQSYNNIAYALDEQGRVGQALALYEKSLAIKKKTLGDEHPSTAHTYNNVATCLLAQGKVAQARPLFERVLAIRRKVRGEVHHDTAVSYQDLANCLEAQGQAAQALPLHERALAIYRFVLPEGHPTTARSYMILATSLTEQGNTARALPLFEKALATLTKTLGEDHPTTVRCSFQLAMGLHAQGKAAQALPLLQKALANSMAARGEAHLDTAQGYTHVAVCLQSLGQAAQALPLFEKALAIHLKARGEDHPTTAASYNNVATCLLAQNAPAKALPLFEKALAIHRKALGENHLDTGFSYNNVAMCLHRQGKYAQALPLFEKAVTIRSKAKGGKHHRSADWLNNLAYCLHDLGRHKEAISHWERALAEFDVARLARAEAGFDRARFGARSLTLRQGLAQAHARLNQPEKAWAYAEADLARNLLDDLAAPAPEDREAAQLLRRLDERLLPLFGQEKLSADRQALRDELARQRDGVLTQLARRAAARSAGQVVALAEVQKALPADAALVLWAGGGQQNWGCVVRAQGPPHWVPLPGNGVKGAWAPTDYGLPDRLRAALADPTSTADRRRELTQAVHKQWVAPLLTPLGAQGRLPAVKRLFVVPPPPLGQLPVEVLAPNLKVSYAHSATLLVKALKDHRLLRPTPALALGDPTFQPPAQPAPPKSGVLVAAVQPGGPADKAGLRPGDVLLRYEGAPLQSGADLVAALRKSARGQATYWRDGKEATAALAPPYGFSLDRRPAPEAVKALREASASVARAEAFAPLRGARGEVLAIQRLLGQDCRTLLGSAASQQALEGLAKELRGLRVLHLATHGLVDLAHPERSRIILARDRLPTLSENADRAARGQRPYTGELTVDAILNDWRLDADLVVLSACQTGLGARSSGDGLLGFPYALIRAGARSVVLSRWKVDDEATALLMVRFYENLLGQAKGLKAPMGRADALAEAKTWLRDLPRQDAERLAAALGANKLAGTRGSIVDLGVKDRPKLPAGARPYEHPFFWAAFTLVGDPD